MLEERSPFGMSEALGCHGRYRLFWALALLVAVAGSLGAGTGDPSRAGQVLCNVPSAQYPTVQSAVDGACEEATLDAGEYNEFVTIDKAFVLIGPSDFSAGIYGQVTVETTAPVDIRFIAIRVGGDPSGIFSDGFESGDTTAWS